MPGVHDLGGAPGGKVDQGQHEIQDWERLADAVTILLDRKGLKTTDEHRRTQENLENYAELSYYERWTAATEALLVEKNILTREEIDAKSAESKEQWGKP